MSRRLISRSGGTVTSSASGIALPEYEPPSYALNEDGRRAIHELSNDRTTAVYLQHMNDSLRFLGSSVGDLHERLREQHHRLETQSARREEKGTDKSAEEQRLEEHISDLETRVEALTNSSEQAVRQLIDRKAELEDEAGVLEYCYNNVESESVAAHSLAQDPQNDEGDETKPPVSAVLKVYQDQRSKKEEEYKALSMHQRYALNNDYAAFKKLWHDSMAGEDGPPLPNASRWFRPNGQPVMHGLGSGTGSADDDVDDDIAVSREVLSINCPLTLQPMKEPYSNRKCKHTFEKAAILDYLPLRGGEVQCPQTGCSEVCSLPSSADAFLLANV